MRRLLLGLWRQPPAGLAPDRKIARFQRLVEHHAEILELLWDLREKRSGEYVLDRRYIEAQMDRVYDKARQALYEMHVISGSGGPEAYALLDGLRARSEALVRAAKVRFLQGADPETEEDADWELLALEQLHRHLAGPSPMHGDARTLADLVGGTHVSAAHRIAETLPTLSARPSLTLRTADATAPFLQVFPLASVRTLEGPMAAQLTGDPEPSGLPPSLMPLAYFHQGLAHHAGEPDTPRLRLAPSREGARKGAACPLKLYVGEAFLLLVLPSSAPLRLCWCALSPQRNENIFYLFGSPPVSGFEGASPVTPRPGSEAFSSYAYATPDAWTCWAAGFTWTQGEERIRLLGDLLGDFAEDVTRQASERESGERLREGVSALLTQIVPRDRNP